MSEKKKNSTPGRRPRLVDQTMTQRDLATRMNEQLSWKFTAVESLECVQAMLECLKEAMLQHRNIEFRDFGVFEVVERQARTGRNPKKPEDVFEIPARKVVKFRASRKLSEKIAQS